MVHVELGMEKKKENGEQRRLKGKKQKKEEKMFCSKYEKMDFPSLPQHANIPEAWHLPTFLSGAWFRPRLGAAERAFC